MTRWELCEVVAGPETARIYFYATEKTRETSDPCATRRYMAQLAHDGWELVSVVEEGDLFYYYFNAWRDVSLTRNEKRAECLHCGHQLTRAGLACTVGALLAQR